MFDTEKQQKFWEQYQRFLSKTLITESPNKITYNLSALAQNDLLNAYQQFFAVELSAIQKLYDYIQSIELLQTHIQKVLLNKNRIFILGCGASGRLAVLIRRIFELNNPNYKNQIIAIASAGDTSLIKSVEQFEDSPEFGISQLQQTGFKNTDLVIGLSASGESPFILSAIEYAHLNSNENPWLIYNNPTNTLIERNSKHILNTLPIQSLALDVGGMALTGSTRLQATTAMLIALGIAISQINCKEYLDQIYQIVSAYPFGKISSLTITEAEIFKSQAYTLYQTNDQLLGLSLLADITERSPTFNLTPFENTNDLDLNQISPYYLSIINQSDNHLTWEWLLGYTPICLNWESFPQTTPQYLYGFDISNNSPRTQETYLSNKQYNCSWLIHQEQLTVSCKDTKLDFPIYQDKLINCIIYKLLLNSNSTLTMGRLGYFDGNLMLSLKPSNFKLVDRTIRYIQFILNTKYKLQPEYKQIANYLFEEIPNLKANESIVLKIVNKMIHLHD